jgi:class 3 adenylate cyclase/tetratricopeptide (TPR) repeat protein
MTCPACGKESAAEFAFCPFCGAALAEASAETEREERKIVTVLFADLAGFTSRVETLDPEDVRALLSRYHGQLRAKLESFGGTVEKFIGDAVMAVFGAPVAHEDDPERAVRAALAIRDWAREQGDEMRVRIGVGTGETLVSLDARPGEGESMVAGDIVNTAARLQAAAPLDGVLVSEATQRATSDAIEYREVEPVVAKGKAEPVLAWEALQARSRFGVDVAPSALAPLVGRGRELELLVSTLARVREESEPQLISVVGVPGIGKSRLVSELFRIVDEESALITWRQGRSLPYGEGVAFWALAEIVKAQAGILESDSPEQTEQKLARAAGRAGADGAEAQWLARHLRPLVGLGEGDEVPVSRDEGFAAWRRFLESLAEERPLVLVFEDLHWADDALLDFVDQLVERVSSVPLLVLATARPELLQRRPGWGGGKPNVLAISLAPLSDEETARLVHALLERSVLDAETQDALLTRCGGNPLYAEQYTRVLLERGDVGELPETVQGIIAARLDALSDDEKRLLQDAAVFGKVFWLGAVQSVDGVTRWRAEELLHALERKEFLRRSRVSSVAGESEYSFRHVLIRDVAYGQIPRAARSQKHQRAADWIVGLGRADDHAELLAHHYLQAIELGRAAGLVDDPGLVEQARRSLRDAGERAIAVTAFAAAAQSFSAALDLCPQDDPERPRLLLGQGSAIHASGGGGLELVDQALEAFRAAGDAEGAGEAAAQAARMAWRSGDRAATDRYLEIALDVVADAPVSRGKTLALTAYCGLQMLAGTFEESIRVGTEAQRLAEELGMHEVRGRLLINMGCARCGLGDEDGLREIELGIAIAREHQAFENLVIGYGNLASELSYLGRLREAREAWQEWSELSDRYGSAYIRHSVRAEGMCWALLDGRWDDALDVADELVAGADTGDRLYSDPMTLGLRSYIRLARGDTSGADVDSERAVALARESDAQAQAQAYCMRASFAIADSRRGEAEDMATLLAAIGPVLLPALCSPFPPLAEVAWIFKDLGREDEFLGILEATPISSRWIDAARAIVAGDLLGAADIIADVGDTVSAAYARMRAGEALAGDGRHGAAGEQLQRALDFYMSVGAVRYVTRCEALLAASA